ncbi:MAG: hypothetical protein ACI90Q_001145 [Nonlabens sp.]
MEEKTYFIRKLSGKLKAPKDYDFDFRKEVQEEGEKPH